MIPLDLHLFYNILQTKFEISMMTIIRIFPLFWRLLISPMYVCIQPYTTHQYRENMTDQSTRTPSIQTSGTPNIPYYYMYSCSTKVWILWLAFFFHWLSHYHTIKAFINYLFINLYSVQWPCLLMLFFFSIFLKGRDISY